jgi:hypothetical protein
MPFEEVQIGGQHTQEMVIASIHDEFLKCRMAAFEGTEAGRFKCGPIIILSRPTGTGLVDLAPQGGKLVDVSKPHGLRRKDMPAGYTWVDSNTRKDADGNEESLQMPYKTGEKIHVTKGLVEPMDTAIDVVADFGQAGETLQINTTVDIFVDENRQGRSWGSPSGGGGLPSGYSGKCIVLCENGTEISGQVLFKSGCEGAALNSGTEEYGAEVAGNPDLSGNLSGDTVTGTPITVYLHVGSGTNNPISGNWDFNVGTYPTAWTGQFTGDLLNNNWVAVKIPTGVKVDVIPYNGYTYVIPQEFHELSGIGTNRFAEPSEAGAGEMTKVNYDVLIAPTTGFAAFVNYSAHLQVTKFEANTLGGGKKADVVSYTRRV